MNSEFTIAVHSLVYLAYLPDHMATSECIARNVSTNPARIRKVMSCLKKNGFVATKEGIGGGYILNLDPMEMNLGEIYRALSCGSIKPGWLTGDPDGSCPVSSKIQPVMDQVFEEAEDVLETFLNSITIASLLHRVKHQADALHIDRLI